MNEPTKAECLANAQADWRAYEHAKMLALACLESAPLQAQMYNQQAAAARQSAEYWERRAKEIKE